MIHYNRNNRTAVELEEAGILSELPSGELWIAGELAGFAFTPSAADFFHVRKVYDFHRSAVMFCGRVDECVNFVQAVECEPGSARAARLVPCRCTGAAPPLEVCQGTGRLHRWERQVPRSVAHVSKNCGDCGANAGEYFSGKGA